MTNKLIFVKRIVEIKKEIEQKTIVSVDDCDNQNYTCLMLSEDIKYLISEKANINHINNKGSIEITNFYLEKGLDINHVDNFGNNTLTKAYNNDDIQYFLLKNK